jgi:hypothetical protein
MCAVAGKKWSFLFLNNWLWIVCHFNDSYFGNYREEQRS